MSPLRVRARDHRGLDGDRSPNDDWRRTRLRAAAQRRTPMGGFLVPRGMGASPGEESCPIGVAFRRSRRSRSSARSSHHEVEVRPSSETFPGDDKAGISCLIQAVDTIGRRKRNSMRRKRVSHTNPTHKRLIPSPLAQGRRSPRADASGALTIVATVFRFGFRCPVAIVRSLRNCATETEAYPSPVAVVRFG
jgi:hypothetical protein